MAGRKEGVLEEKKQNKRAMNMSKGQAIAMEVTFMEKIEPLTQKQTLVIEAVAEMGEAPKGAEEREAWAMMKTTRVTVLIDLMKLLLKKACLHEALALRASDQKTSPQLPFQHQKKTWTNQSNSVLPGLL